MTVRGSGRPLWWTGCYHPLLDTLWHLCPPPPRIIGWGCGCCWGASCCTLCGSPAGPPSLLPSPGSHPEENKDKNKEKIVGQTSGERKQLALLSEQCETPLNDVKRTRRCQTNTGFDIYQRSFKSLHMDKRYIYAGGGGGTAERKL